MSSGEPTRSSPSLMSFVPPTTPGRRAPHPVDRRGIRLTGHTGRRERRWCQMRKGVSDLWRTFQVGAAANHRYLDAMAAAPLKDRGVEALDASCRPWTKNGRTYARFSPLTEGDPTLFRAALAGEHARQFLPARGAPVAAPSRAGTPPHRPLIQGAVA